MSLQTAFLPNSPLQTVEAMQAILDDLTIDDQFSIIDFNHNVRCWSEELVPGSSIQIADAKKYIQSIKPNGGETTLYDSSDKNKAIVHWTPTFCCWHQAPTSMKPWWEQFRCWWRRPTRAWSAPDLCPWSFWCLMETPQLVGRMRWSCLISLDCDVCSGLIITMLFDRGDQA